MVKLSTAEAREKFASIVKKAAQDKERIILTKGGKDWAALVPMEDMRLLEDLEDRLDLEEARAALAEAKADTTPAVSWERIKSELGI